MMTLGLQRQSMTHADLPGYLRCVNAEFYRCRVTKTSADHVNEDWLLQMRAVEFWELWKALLYFSQGLALGELTSL